MKVLMHMCCAPCSVYPAGVLREDGISLEGLFYNPNIHPIEEFKKRQENVEIYSTATGIPVTYFDEFKQDTWEKFSGDSQLRCNMCYSTRLEKTAETAKNKGFDAFTTSLLVSPYQKHEVIKGLGEGIGKKFGVQFYYRDFREGFRKGQQQAKDMGLYRQKFCGCIISYHQSPHTNKK